MTAREYYPELKDGTIYPWKKWFSRKRAFTLLKRKDYKCASHIMAGQIRNAACRFGLSVSVYFTIDIGRDGLEIKVNR